MKIGLLQVIFIIILLLLFFGDSKKIYFKRFYLKNIKNKLKNIINSNNIKKENIKKK